MTIDIIAMLFDNIFEDSHIPSSAKALLGRLQIPTLKVALLDKSFFSSKAHPARRLLDLLAQAAIGVDEGSSRESPALAMIEGVVDRVLAEFETDLALFEEMAQRVAAFIEQQKSAEGAIVERSARLIEERERDEIAREVAEQEIGRRLESRAGVPPAVREMPGRARSRGCIVPKARAPPHGRRCSSGWKTCCGASSRKSHRTTASASSRCSRACCARCTKAWCGASSTRRAVALSSACSSTATRWR
jgi:hypothetical protein